MMMTTSEVVLLMLLFNISESAALGLCARAREEQVPRGAGSGGKVQPETARRVPRRCAS